MSKLTFKENEVKKMKNMHTNLTLKSEDVINYNGDGYEIAENFDKFKNFTNSLCINCSKCCYTVKVNKFNEMAYWDARCLMQGINLIGYSTVDKDVEPLSLPIVICSQFEDKTY